MKRERDYKDDIRCGGKQLSCIWEEPHILDLVFDLQIRDEQRPEEGFSYLKTGNWTCISNMDYLHSMVYQSTFKPGCYLSTNRKDWKWRYVIDWKATRQIGQPVWTANTYGGNGGTMSQKISIL